MAAAWAGSLYLTLGAMPAFAGPPVPPLQTLWPILPGTLAAMLVRRACLVVFGKLGARLALSQYGAEWRDRLKTNAPEAFAERCFYALVHFICTAFGGWVCWSCGWLTTRGDFFFAFPWPHALPPAHLSAARAYYVLEGSLAVESTLNLVCEATRTGVRRNLMMVTHHAVTLLLISASWRLGIPETGSVVMWLHAASDIPIDLLKAADQLKWEAVLIPLWALAVVCWVGFRFVFMPVHLLWPGYCKIRRTLLGDCAPYFSPGQCPGLQSGMLPQIPEFVPGTSAWLGLIILVCLHALWLMQLLKKAAPFLFKAARGAGSQLDVPDMCAPGFVAAGTDRSARRPKVE